MLRNPRPIFPPNTGLVVTAYMVPTWIVAIVILVFPRTSAAQTAIEYGHIATGSSAGLSGLSNKIDSTLSPDKKPSYVVVPDKQARVVTAKESNPEDSNRLSLEQHAGQDAAKLSLKSVPTKAAVQIDGKPVGQTPLSISLAPGTYRIEMQGPRAESGKQQLNLGPKETRELELPLSAPPRYPSQITLQ
ncbi:MAG: PEGA domain-containing protein [Acidobacteriota bacterium]|nr:PEGA domain-containing protein [Acidobacteriota bacterium]